METQFVEKPGNFSCLEPDEFIIAVSSYFRKAHFNIIFSCMPRCCEWPLSYTIHHGVTGKHLIRKLRCTRYWCVCVWRFTLNGSGVLTSVFFLDFADINYLCWGKSCENYFLANSFQGTSTLCINILRHSVLSYRKCPFDAKTYLNCGREIIKQFFQTYTSTFVSCVYVCVCVYIYIYTHTHVCPAHKHQEQTCVCVCYQPRWR